MRNFMEAYAAVHNTEAKEEFYSQRDPVSEMNTASLTDDDLREIAEEVCEELFAKGFQIQEAADVLSDVLEEGENAGRNAKLSRLFDAFAEAFDRIQTKANELEAFAQYRNSKRLQETWSSRFNQDKRIQRHHKALVAEDAAQVKAGILQMVQEKKKSGDPCWVGYKQVGMKKKGGKMVPNCVPATEATEHEDKQSLQEKGMNPGFKAYLEKKKKKGGDDEGGDSPKGGGKPDFLDLDKDGDKKESMKKAAHDKKKGMKEAYGTGAAMIRGGGKPKKKVDVFAYDRKIGKKTLPDGRPLPPAPKNEGVQFSEAELKAFEEIVNSWED